MGRTRLALDRSLTLGTVAERLAAVYGDRLLVDEDGWTVTHVQAADLVERWSATLAARIAPGDRVVLATPNGHRQLLATLAVCRAGGVAVPVNAQMRPAEVDHVVADAGAPVVVRDVAELEPSDPAGRPAVPAGRRRPTPTTWPRSSTPRVRPAARRACGSATGPSSGRRGSAR